MQKIAILIEGGFFLKALKSIFKNKIALDQYDITSAPDVVKLILGQVNWHLNYANTITCAENPRSLLYRIYYYDALPFQDRIHYPISNKTIQFGTSPEALFRKELFELLKIAPDLALRLGEVRKGDGWVLNQNKQAEIIKILNKGDQLKIDDFSDNDFHFELRQKGVDMRIGIDIATLVLKKQVDTIVLFSGDGDFIPAAKLARVEGVKFILDIMGQKVSSDLLEHVDKITSSFSTDSVNSILNKNEWHK